MQEWNSRFAAAAPKRRLMFLMSSVLLAKLVGSDAKPPPSLLNSGLFWLENGRKSRKNAHFGPVSGLGAIWRHDPGRKWAVTGVFSGTFRRFSGGTILNSGGRGDVISAAKMKLVLSHNYSEWYSFNGTNSFRWYYLDGY